jgi:Glyoxalase-like domain
MHRLWLAYCVDMLAGPRLRQVAVVAADLDGTVRQLHDAFGWTGPYHDPGVGQFGLANAVFAAGDTFVEVVCPVEPVTTAGRYLARRGGDSGYMAIFQLPDLAQARRRVAEAGIRVVWSADLPDIAGTHLHPKDVPGAIVSLDWADPPESWHWAGPQWTGGAPAHPGTGLTGITVEVNDPPAAAARWAQALGLTVTDEGGTITIELASARQELCFVPVTSDRGEGITEVRLTTVIDRPQVQVAGVRFVSVPATTGGGAA